MEMQKHVFLSKSPAETTAIAKAIAPLLQFGDVVLLDGDLGSGKTHFVKATAEELGAETTVTSPTYNIAMFHKIEEGNVLHIDAYRLSGADEFLNLGLDEYFPESITLIEWGELVMDAFDCFLHISFSYHGDMEHGRTIELRGHGGRWVDAMPTIEHTISLI